MNSRVAGRRSGLVGLLFLLVLLVLAGTQSQRITDWYRLRGYQPPAEIAELAKQTTMTPAARHLFYINRPVLAEKQIFRQSCPEYEASIVIGCYQQGQRGIHLLKVTDPRLQGIEQVTAAHEMLHAAYDRLSSKERNRVDGWLQAYAANGLQDRRIAETLENYRKTEPGVLDNEMHSIFGTEVATLTDELEQYYARFFLNRQTVVSFATDYQQAFTSRQQKISQVDSQLNARTDSIKNNTEALARQREALSEFERRLEDDRIAGNTAVYNAGVVGYNQQVADYNSLLEKTRLQVAQYNQMVIERNILAEQTVELREAIDSSSLPESR